MRSKNLVNNEVICNITNIIPMLKEEYLEDIQGVIYDDQDELREHGLEVASYHLVSDWLMRRLRAYGEYVAEIDSMNVWHRTSGNQPIYQDFVMQKIADDLKFI